MKTVDQIKNKLDGEMAFLKKAYGVKTIGVFGSVARDESRKSSDIDILVEFSRPLGFFKFLELEKYLSTLLEKKVDLVTRKALKPVIREDILKEVIYV